MGLSCFFSQIKPPFYQQQGVSKLFYVEHISSRDLVSYPFLFNLWLHHLPLQPSWPMYAAVATVIAKREARRIIVLPDSGPCGYIRIYIYMSATDVGWAPPGGR